MEIKKFKDKGKACYMVSMNQAETLSLVRGLVTQMQRVYHGPYGPERAEFWSEKGEYFSISVSEESERFKKEGE